MSEAWNTAPRTSDAKIHLRKGFDLPEMKQKRNDSVPAVRQQLTPSPLRWLRRPSLCKLNLAKYYSPVARQTGLKECQLAAQLLVLRCSWCHGSS